MSNPANHAYVLVSIQPGKEQDFANEIVVRGLIVDPVVEKLDFVHGPFDFIIILTGDNSSIDKRIFEIRKLPWVLGTETLSPFEMFSWDDISTMREAALARSLLGNKPKGHRSSELELKEKIVSPVVVFATKRGNTKRVANEIAGKLNCPCLEITTGTQPTSINLDKFDLVIIGTGIYQRSPNPDLVRFLESTNLEGNKQYALFLTWYKIADNDQTAFNKIDEVLRKKGKELAEGYFECLGDASKGHPNEDDISSARKWVSKISQKT